MQSNAGDGKLERLAKVNEESSIHRSRNNSNDLKSHP